MKGFIGLDFETSGSDHDESAPIQLGMAYLDDRGDPHTYVSYIGGWKWVDEPEDLYPRRGWNEYVWHRGAANVHKIPKETLATAPLKFQVDREAVAWLDELPDLGNYKLIPVGWNIASFDMPFVKQHLPNLMKRFQYRSVDLNANVFTVDQMNLFKATGGRWKFSTAKKVAKKRAAARAKLEFPDADWHDAGFDALASLYAWDELQKMIQSSKLSEGKATRRDA